MSKQFLKSATYSVHQLFKRASDLSYKSRYDYEKNFIKFMHQLHESGSAISNVHHLKPKHIQHLIQHWQTEQLNPATIKNRLSMIRYVSHRIHKPQLIPANNQVLGIPNRAYATTHNKAIESIDLTKIKDDYVRYSVSLQRLFGLRREESIKFIPSYADQGDYIRLKGSWTKGGIERIIPLTHPEQRQFLNTLKTAISKGCSLIPSNRSYIQQENTYVAQIRQAGFKNLHGLRHAYAQTLYRHLTDTFTNGQGWDCPKKGGPSKTSLDINRQQIDHKVRFIIANHLGHSRINITRIYC